MSLKLKNIVESFQQEESIKQFLPEEKKEILEMISDYNSLGEALSRQGSLPEIAEKMSKMCEAAKHLTLSESEGDWFNGKVVQENMKNLEKHSTTFNKLAQEAYGVEQQLTALYEDMGHILGRYFDIKEPIQEIDSVDDF